MVEYRRPIKLLPPVNQTETLTKFFAATVDHLFQPESVEFISAYIGSKPVYYNPITDFYVGEPTKSRIDYQLPATAVSKNTNSDALTNVMFYDDFVNVLKFHGANTENHSRLFDQEYYSWTPPVDLDKIVNYTKYYWAPLGPSPILLLDKTTAADIIGNSQYTYDGLYQLSSTGELINGSLTFTTGLIVTFTDDTDIEINGIPKYINNVGRSIQLITPPPISETLAEIKDYMTLGVSQNPTNQWSSNNCWYHEDVFTISDTVIGNSFQSRAARPIIEFDSNLQLMNSGWTGKSAVTVVSTATNVFDTSSGTVPVDSDDINNIVGLSSVTIDGVLLTDGDTILVTQNTDITVNGRIYQVGGLDIYGAITLTAIGALPVLGDTVFCTGGTVYGSTQLWYNDTAWVLSQQRVPYAAPLFMLYDSDGNAINDPSVYPGSNFVGNAIFTYAVDQYATLDSELGIRPKKNQFGNYVFNNTMVSTVYTYQYNTVITDIEGFYYYQSNLDTDVAYDNAWYKAPNLSRQYIVNDFTVTTPTISFRIDQTPDLNPGVLPSIYVVLIRDEAATLLVNGIDYVVNGRVVTLATSTVAGDRVNIRSWSKSVPQGLLGYYELPLNLTANPNNSQITSISQSQFITQFDEIITNQPGFVGNGLGNNNWRDTPRIRGLGFSILQHRAPMLKTMILSSSNVTVGINTVQSDTDPMLAMQFAQREYLRFYNRFVSALFTLYANGYTLNQTPETWVSTALKQINLGKTPASAFANSGPDVTQGAYCNSKSTNPTYVPPTATRLGCAPAYQPTVYYDMDNLVIQCHDGARIVMAKDGIPLGGIADGKTSTASTVLLTNAVAAAWLQFELDLFNNLPDRYRNAQATLALDIRDYTPGKWRDGAYTVTEFNNILLPMFDKWVITNQVDYRANTTYDPNDQFTWNYHSVPDQNGLPVPGYYQGIYRWFYDTDRPHTHPWEMLGFSQRPDWWTAQYGAAPYTAGNLYMWEDLSAGLIRQGPRAGVHPTWARPGLLKCIPVDNQGNLLPPIAAGTVTSFPSSYDAQAEWVFGDGSPVESVWIYSNDYNFAIAEYSYLMKPAQFIEYNWDTIRSKQVFADQPTSQWIYIDTDDRRPNGQFYVQRENPLAIGGNINVPNESTLSYFGSCGMQHWISEYLVNRNLGVTQYFGSIIRGTNVQLAHQMGGFISSSLYLTADSFGQIGYKSQIIPSENVKTYLYKSASINTSFYGGVIITQLRNGYRVIGYDGVKQYFEIIPSNALGAKTYVLVGNERVIWFKQGADAVQQVPYGTVFATRQEVFDFLIGLQRSQEAEGWAFETYNEDGNYIYDWQQSAKEFLFWSQGNWANGNFIALSPLANGAKFIQRLGSVQFVNGIVGGTYPLLDKTGSPIQGQNVEVLRYTDELTITATNTQSIYGLRLFATTLESIIVIDNQTAFGDIVYDPLYNQAQPRLKLFAYRTNDWTGRVDAPGYFLYQNGTDNQWNLVSNFEKTANDFRKYFNIEQPKNYTTVDPITGNLVQASTTLAVVDVQSISEISKHLIGYQQRGYLQNLLLEDSTEFQFYQGFIRQKGTEGAINKILRNDSIIPVTSDFAYYEEYALRAARFGSTALNIGIDFVVPQSQYINDPQQITVYGTQGSDRELDGVIVLIPNDPKIVVPPISYSSVTNPLFPVRPQLEEYSINDLPTTGYVLVGETNYTVTNTAALSTLYGTQLESNVRLKDGDTVWQFIDDQNSWTVWQYSKANVNIVNTTPSISNGDPTVINTTGNVGVSPGDIVVLSGISNVSALDGTWTVGNIESNGNSFTVDTNTFAVGSGGNFYAYKKVRFANVTDRDLYPPFNGWKQGNLAWVDKTNVGIQGWTVYEYLNNSWMPKRIEQPKVDAALMLQAKLYSKTKLNVYGDMQYYDPAKGFIPKEANNNLNYTFIYDPAAYTDGDPLIYPLTPSRAWGPEHIGQTWWDLSAVRYYDYEISDTAYRWQNWGAIAPNTTVDVYEWVQSPVLPASWATYIANGTSFSQFGLNYMPTGTVRNASNPAWTTGTTYTSAGTTVTYYYFWVKNAYTIPLPPDRAVTTLELSNLITNPTAYGVTWYAAIDDRNIIVSNIGRLLSGNDTVLSLFYTHQANEQVDYKEWDLIRENDPFSMPTDYYWTKLKDSLTGKDGLSNNVPDPYLSDLMRYGTLIRPRQSWFKDRTAAAEAYVTKANQLLSTILLVPDSNRSNWVDYFYAADLAPSADYTVATISSRNALGGTIDDGSTVLVLGGADTANLWILYQYSFNGGDYVWTAIQVQSYNTPNYWYFIDWYLPGSGVTASTIPTYTVPDLASRITYAGVNNVVVKVLNIGDGRWALYKWATTNNVDGWITVGYQDGTIQISDGVYNGTINTMLWDTTPFDTVTFDIYPYIEFGYMIDGIRYSIFEDLDPHNTTGGTAPLNNLFFTMINYVLVEQGFVDWIIKTSYIVLKGFNIPLTTSTLYKPDNTDALLAYINEVKPYHAKVREFITGRTWQDNAYVHATDFDNPANVSVSTNIAYSNVDWQNNYLTNPQLIRTLKTTLVFDRIASYPAGWDTYPWVDKAWSLETGSYTPELISWGAWERIQQFYAPTADMIRKDDPNLIPNSDYRGIIIDGIGFSYRPGWDLAPWDAPTGWQANQASFDNYLDIIIEGGITPKYDYYFGTGTKTAFKLSKLPQSPAGLVVWSDQNIRDYGVDWIIPNYATSALIIQGGAQYQIGDNLQLDIVPNNEPTRFTVTGVDINGAILSLTLDTTGQYDIWPAGDADLIYQPYHTGIGYGATVKPVWGSNTLVFKQAPNSNSAPNIFVLYVGTTFIEAPTGPLDIINDGNKFIQPFVAENHPEELYTGQILENIRMDTYTETVGGAPVIYMRVYKLDGVQDQFDMGLRPMDTSSVIVQKDGVILNYGLSNDYIINWATNRVVFLLPPVGTKLQIMTIAAGGSGTGIYNPAVVNTGNGYSIGDIVTFAGGQYVDYDAASVEVTSVLVSQINIISGGIGYAVGDVLVLEDDYATVKLYATELTVQSIDIDGGISSATINQPGSYQYTPITTMWLTSGSGTGAEINTVWGIDDITRANPGTYSVHPTAPIEQLATTGAGVDATFSSLYTAIQSQNTYNVDGSQNIFVIDMPVPNDNVSLLLVTVDGVITTNINASGREVTIVTVPPAGSTVGIVLFNSSDYSIVYDQTIIMITGINNYLLTPQPYSTSPVYLSTTVTLNGLELAPPTMYVYKSNGSILAYHADYMPANPTYLQVWVSDYLMTNGIEYTIVGNDVVFYVAPANDSIISLVIIDPVHGYNYIIIPNYIVISPSVTFTTGDILKIITYSEDVSYKFRSQTFAGPAYPPVSGMPYGTYVLADTPWNDSALMVWVNNEMQALLYDYTYEVSPGIPGWDTTPWEEYGWNAEFEGEGVLIFGDNIAHSVSDTIYVQYMSGAVNKVATAFRTVNTGNAMVDSIAINSSRSTLLLSDVNVVSDSIEVEDYTVLSLPTDYRPGVVWIGDERIAFWTVTTTATLLLPNRGILSTLQRGTLNTPSGNVSTLYNTIFYDGNGSTVYFATAAGTVPLGGTEEVYIGQTIQLDTAEYPNSGTYAFVINPVGQSPGRYVQFNVAPVVGWRNVKICAPELEAKITSNISHPAGSIVQDGGYSVEIPGGYAWQAAQNGLQYNNTALANFLLANSGMRN